MDTNIKLPGLPSGLTLTVDVVDTATLAVLEADIALTETSGIYAGDVTGAHAGRLLFVLKASGTTLVIACGRSPMMPDRMSF